MTQRSNFNPHSLNSPHSNFGSDRLSPPPPNPMLAATVNPAEGSAERGCYSFCMCPGGQIVPTAMDANQLCINGMSFSKRASKVNPSLAPLPSTAP